jgi:hypothetical protein
LGGKPNPGVQAAGFDLEVERTSALSTLSPGFDRYTRNPADVAFFNPVKSKLLLTKLAFSSIMVSV